MNTDQQHNDPCQHFLDHLDEWLGQSMGSQQSALMQSHHDGCQACQMETRLAREIEGIVQDLPAQYCPKLELPTTKQKTTAATESLVQRLLDAWRQPLVFGPGIALLLLIGALLLPQTGNNPEPALIVINGETYTPEEVIAAAEELEIALEYLGKYSNYPAMLVSSELRETTSLRQQQNENDASPSI